MRDGPDDHAYWDGVADQDDRLPAGWRRRARHEHLELVGRWVGPPTGRWLKTDLFEERSPDRALLPHLEGDWVGTDLSPHVARQASGRVGRRAVAADVRRLPFGDGSSTACSRPRPSTTSTTRVRSPGRSWELRRVLRDGGWLVLTLDNPANPLIRLRNALPDRTARRTGLVPFSVGATLGEADGRRALEATGFTVDATAFLLHAPHVVGTRLARWRWYEERVLPRACGVRGSTLAPTGTAPAL